MAASQRNAILRHLQRLLGERPAAAGSDRQLLERFVASNDESAFVALLERYQALVLGVCRSVLHQEQDAEDAFQATFLVLARKADAIRKHDSIASWLHGVALRTALNLRRSLITRRRNEQRAATRTVEQPVLDAALRELQAILHEEVERLPGKYRAPFVLCCLEGKSRAEAARELGWKEGSVSAWIAQARLLLQRRLARRGVTLSAALTSAAVAPNLAIAATLAPRVVRSALAFAAGKSCDGVSAQAVFLAKGVIQTMFATRLKLVAVATLALLVLSGVSLLAGPALLPQKLLETDPPQPAAKQPAKAEAEQPQHKPQADKPKPPPPPDNTPRPYRVLNDRRVSFPLTSLVFSRDGKMLASVEATFAPGALGSYRTILVDVATGQRLHELATHSELVNQIAFAPDNKRVCTGSRLHDGGIASRMGTGLVVWDTATGKPVKELQAQVWDLSPDGKTLAIADNFVDIDPGINKGDDIKPLPSTFTLRLLDTTTWKEIAQRKETNLTLSILRFAPDSKMLALALSDYTIRLWDWQANKETKRITAPKVDPQKWAGGAITHLAFNHDGTRLASVTDTVFFNEIPRKVDVWDVPSGKSVQTLTGPRYPITSLAFTPRGDQLAVAGRQNYFNLFDVASGEKRKDSERPGLAELAVALYRVGLAPEQAPKGPPLLTRLWNLASGEDIVSGKLPSELQCLTLSPNDRTLAVGDMKGVVRLYDLGTGNEVRQFADTGKSPVNGLTYLQDGKLLCSQHWNRPFRFWDPETGKPISQQLPGIPFGKSSLVVSSQGKLASVPEAGIVVTIWKDLMDRRPVKVRLPQSARTLQFAPDGKKLLAGSWEKVVQVIDVDRGVLLKPIGREHIVMFALSPDGKTVAGWGRTANYKWDPYVALWDLHTGEELGRIDVTPTSFNGMRFTPDGRGLWVETAGGFSLFEMATGLQRGFVSGAWPLSLSSKGRLFVCKSNDCIFVWDMTGRNNGGILDTTPLTQDELAKRWADLQAGPVEAYQAVWRLAGVPEQTVPFLEAKLRTVPPLDPKRIPKLIADLENDVFAIREKASEELPKYGHWALKEATATLAKNPPPETRRRLLDLKPRLRDYPFSPEQTLALRVVEVLEQIGTPAARRLLERLAGNERPQFTEAARAALGRWK